MSGHVDSGLLEILVCPSCRGDLHLRTAGSEHDALECAACKVYFPITNGIPVMLVEEARPLSAHA